MDQIATDIRRKLRELKDLKKATCEKWMQLRSEESRIDEQIRKLKDSCPRRTGKRHAGGGGGLGAQMWLHCDDCNENHILTKQEFDNYPGKITWVSTGN